ncbi:MULTISPECIES: hypothetical protein [unclassified Sphingomonas]|uniref:hypothetical protein n=1 Tax=unclassified Sphingomonas TaxID=196159 RepID=UPI00285A0BE4|nr:MULTISPECIES: hypothetical protein [unclassified Sphingomonas]MDR6116684.1 DNA-directed RNA polymerase subunit RPC12/RpoP [Sphingomonas sp. SORGH_AS_0789]MDR6149638.1 DNA-directed RNA polymerase subunit RPC12/RpoP [Sphingomonas sp. SORGH_AS_0742]
MVDYRNDARRELARAKDELGSVDDERLKYAALELRMAMESLTYDRALAYKEEFPPAEYETWQPRKVMAVLLEIDPNADKDSSLAFGIEPSLGVTPEVMEALGSEKVLNMTTIKRHYDALGAHLHVQTIKQRKGGAPVDHAKFRARCDEIAAYLTEVLASPIWNATIGTFASIDCMKCGHPVRKRMPHDQSVVNAKCFECGATYKVTDAGENEALFEPDQIEVRCANTECKTSIFPWRAEIKAGVGWKCEVCGGQNDVKLMVQHRPAAVADDAAHEGSDA